VQKGHSRSIAALFRAMTENAFASSFLLRTNYKRTHRFGQEKGRNGNPNTDKGFCVNDTDHRQASASVVSVIWKNRHSQMQTPDARRRV